MVQEKGEQQRGALLTLAKFTPRFLTYSENNDKHSSIVTKRQILDDHLNAPFGQIARSAIGPAEIEDFKPSCARRSSAARARKEAPAKAALLRRSSKAHLRFPQLLRRPSG